MSTQPTTLTGVATAIEWQGKTIVVTADDLATLHQYLHANEHEGHPEACHVAVTLGPPAEIPPIPAYHAFAARLNGREYSEEITREEAAEAKAANLVVVFGYSDDGTEFRGAIRDEAGLGDIHLTRKGEILNQEQLEALELLSAIIPEIPRRTIHAKFHPHTYTTDIPHATFDIMEEGELFCRGIVFSITDL